MCSGLKVNMEAKYQPNLSKLLEFSATDDVSGFISEVEEKGCDVNELSYWYGRRFGSRKMGYEERTPILIAAMYGSIRVLSYIVQTGKIDVNRAYGSDGVTALHCAASGGSDSSVEVVKMLLDASADVNSLDANGNRPSDLVASCSKSLSSFKRKSLEMLLQGVVSDVSDGDDDLGSSRIVAEKKEYPIDASLPDINVGLYGTDEFRMYSFKVKPCSRAYSHDWTECPFVHPGENARRRDPKKYHYTCVPCPDFKKGTCSKADNCEYAHGVFESWLHPAQYRTRLCKDETGCARKVCFFAHKPEELRPLYASTGSAMPSPKSVSASMDMSTMSPIALGSTPPMSPSACSSPMGGSNMWQGKMSLTPPTLQLSGSRLKTALNARDMELELGLELLNLENIRSQQQRQQLIEEMAGLASPSSWMQDYNRMGEMKPTNLDDVFNSMDPSLLSHLQALSPKVQSSSSSHSQMNSPSGMRMRQNNNMSQLRASYPSNVSSSPVRKPSPSSGLGFDTSGAVAAAVMNSRSAAFSKRSQSFIDRGAVSHRGGAPGFANPPTMAAGPNVSDWGSPNGKLDWGFNGDDHHSKLRKSASFGIRSGANANANGNAPSRNSGQQLFGSPEQKRNAGFNDIMPSWIDQLYIEQEQMVA